MQGKQELCDKVYGLLVTFSMLFFVVVAQISLVEYDALSCVVATGVNFPGLVSYESSIKSLSFSLLLPLLTLNQLQSFSIPILHNIWGSLLLQTGNLLAIFLFYYYPSLVNDGMLNYCCCWLPRIMLFFTQLPQHVRLPTTSAVNSCCYCNELLASWKVFILNPQISNQGGRGGGGERSNSICV